MRSFELDTLPSHTLLPPKLINPVLTFRLDKVVSPLMGTLFGSISVETPKFSLIASYAGFEIRYCQPHKQPVAWPCLTRISCHHAEST